MTVASRESAGVQHPRLVCDFVAFGRKEVRIIVVGSVQVACPRGWEAVVMALLTVWATASR